MSYRLSTLTAPASKVDYRVDSPEDWPRSSPASTELGLRGGILVTNPIPRSIRWIRT